MHFDLMQPMKLYCRIKRLNTLIPWWQRSCRAEKVPFNRSRIFRGAGGEEERGRGCNVSISTFSFVVKSSVSFDVLVFAELLPLIRGLHLPLPLMTQTSEDRRSELGGWCE